MKSKMAMIDFLKNHRRYDTMNSWNCSTSYAHCVKVGQLHWKNPALALKAYDFVDLSEAYDEVHEIHREFAEAHDWSWQIAFNGRSNGYLVLIQGGYTELIIAPANMQPGERAYSDRIGRWFDYEEARNNGWIGRKWKRIHTQPGKSLDRGETFEDWSMDQVLGRYRLVRTFDEACRRSIRAFQQFVEHHTVEEQTIQVPKHIKVAVPSA